MKRRLFIALAAGLLLGLVGLALSFLQLAKNTEEDIGLALLFKMRGIRTPPADVAVVSIDHESSEQLHVPDDPDRWPRSLHARLIRKLVAQGAAVIAFDVFFIDPKSAQDDNALVTAVRQAGNVVLCEPLVAKEVPSGDAREGDGADHVIVKVVKPFTPLAESAAVTAPFVLPRIPFKVNQFWAFQTGAGDAPTMPMAALQLFAMPAYEDLIALIARVNPNEAAKLRGNMAPPLQAGGVYRLMTQVRGVFEADEATGREVLKLFGRLDPATLGVQRHRLLGALVDLYTGPNRRYVNYYGPPRTVPTISYYQALQLGEPDAQPPPVDLKGKVVFVGLSEKLLAERKDSFYTVFSQANGVFVGGVEIAATALLNVLEHAEVRPASPPLLLAILALWGTMLVVVCRMLHTTLAALIVIGAAVTYVFFATYAFQTSAAWYPIVVPVFVQAPVAFFGVLFWNFSEINRERKHMRKVLAYYVPDELVDQLARNQIDMKNSGQVVYGAILFADIAGYTTLSEKMGPQALSDLMHRYFDATFAPVKQHGGLIAQLKGDCFLAIWKATRGESAMRRNVCMAALEVAAAVRRFNASLELKLPTRVGVHCGEVFIGNVGGGERYEYGPTGDVVNTASRMDNLNKHLGTEVLVSSELLGELDAFCTREVGAFLLKGKAQPMVVHELISLQNDADAEQRRRCEEFAEALVMFKRQAWQEAGEKFKRLVLRTPDGPTYYYLQLCEHYQKNPPEPSWDGVITLAEK